ncbi:hypothetical protein [Flavobacterium sp. N502536]|uniref:hypothetical protein n=1 Tax=Flavobacterium sp. N502536 TaxID=2986837 RepID=UPI0022214476|nr:hypothetical protein [Flavobacterium sp. N502536]
MNVRYFIFVVVLLVSCKEPGKSKSVLLRSNIIKNSQQKKNLDTAEESKAPKYSKIIEVGYYEKLEGLSHLQLDSIEEADYNKIAAKKSFEITEIERQNDFFYIQGAKQKFEFKKYKDYKGELSWSGYEYLGHCAVLNLAALQESSTADYLGFSEMQLLDTSNDVLFKIISLGDASVSIPELSPDHKFMIYFQNPEYESKNQAIVILKVNDKTDPTKFLTEYKSCLSESDYTIEEIKWKSNTVIYIKAYQSSGFDSNGKELRAYFYYKAEI